MVHDIEVGEAPVEGEGNGANSTEGAKEKSEELAWHGSANCGVLEHGSGSLEHGESRVDSESKQGDRQHDGPKVWPEHLVNSSWVSDESETDRSDLVRDWGSLEDKSSHDREDSEASNETNASVDDADNETVSDDWLVLAIETGV